MDRRRFLNTIGGVGMGLVLPRAPTRGPRPSTRALAYTERWSWAMGQPVVLRLYASSESEGYESAQLAFTELRRVEGVLSRFDPASDLTALNEHAGRGPLRVSDDLLRVLRIAEMVRVQSGGAFDPAVEPVMRAWGFHARRRHPPEQRELDEARRAIAAARVRFTDRRVSLAGSGAALDLGGIGVGYGLDRVGTLLRARGIRNAFLDISGDCLALGAPPGTAGWEVGLADPTDGMAPPLRTVRLRDRALATSANTESVIRWRDLVVGHVIDPRTARSAARIRQVSVEAPSGVLADAWSTACFVAAERLPAGLRSYEVR
jgi:thiamine biosynthesis lipoprotein